MKPRKSATKRKLSELMQNWRVISTCRIWRLRSESVPNGGEGQPFWGGGKKPGPGGEGEPRKGGTGFDGAREWPAQHPHRERIGISKDQSYKSLLSRDGAFTTASPG